jgi:hypothetical protein
MRFRISNMSLLNDRMRPERAAGRWGHTLGSLLTGMAIGFTNRADTITITALIITTVCRGHRGSTLASSVPTTRPPAR